MTSIRHRLLVDECLPPALIDNYLAPHIRITKDGVEPIHFFDRFGIGGGIKDPVWVPKIARDRRWLILSADRGKKGSLAESLPLVCEQFGVTLITMTNPIKEQGLAFYGPQILSHWRRFMAAAQGAKGAQYFIRRHSSKTATTLFVVHKCPEGFIAHSGECIPVKPKKT